VARGALLKALAFQGLSNLFRMAKMEIHILMESHRLTSLSSSAEFLPQPGVNSFQMRWRIKAGDFPAGGSWLQPA